MHSYWEREKPHMDFCPMQPPSQTISSIIPIDKIRINQIGSLKKIICAIVSFTCCIRWDNKYFHKLPAYIFKLFVVTFLSFTFFFQFNKYFYSKHLLCASQYFQIFMNINLFVLKIVLYRIGNGGTEKLRKLQTFVYYLNPG